MTDRLNERQNRKSLKVLLLEKKSSLLFDIIRNFLAHAGVKDIYHCEDISGARQLLKSHNINLVIADSDDHSAGGVDLLRIVRAEQHIAHIPFVIISGHANLESVNEVLHLGNAEYLIKPFSELLFQEKLQLALGNNIGNGLADRPPVREPQIIHCKVLVCSNLHIQISSEDVKPELLLTRDIASAVKVLKSETDIDIVILDEGMAKAASEDTRKLLALRTQGQIELVLLLENITDVHVQNLHRLGLLYLVEKSHADLYLNQLVPLLAIKKRISPYVKTEDELEEILPDDTEGLKHQSPSSP